MAAAVLVHVTAIAALMSWFAPGTGDIAGPLLTLDFVSAGAERQEAPPAAEPGPGVRNDSWKKDLPVAGENGVERKQSQPAAQSDSSRRTIAKIKTAKARVSKPVPAEAPAREASLLPESAFDERSGEDVASTIASTSGPAGPTVSAEVVDAHAPAAVSGSGGTPHGHGDNDGRPGAGSGVQDGETRTFGTPDGPAIVRLVRPNYPSEARRLGKEGVVVLKLTIETSGQVGHIETVRSAGFGMEEAAREAILHSRFRPAMLNGSPIVCRALLPLHFKLQ